MTVYEAVAGAVSAWCRENRYVLRAEEARSEGASLPERYVLYAVVSDIDTEYAGDARRRTRYRVQFDIVPEASESAGVLAQEMESLDEVLAEAGMIPQGNRRMTRDRETKRLYAQKDYLWTRERGE